MKVSLNWLREFVELPAEVGALEKLLTLAGVEVEGIESRGVKIEKVVVAQIVDSVQHPNADRLSVCQVDDGSEAKRQIVCGAKNYRVGDKVPLALPGAVLPGNFQLKIGKLRGVESHGMLCSAKELELSADSDGLLILPADARIGAPISELFPGDTILDLEITPNRADLLSHLGIAREIAALTGAELQYSAPVVHREFSNAGVVVDAPEICPFYTALRITKVKVGPSPAWLRDRLESLGLRSINNVVDVTNFVMLEIGQPLHAFDAGKLNGGIRVRPAREGEEFAALDGRAYKLSPRHLLIADEAKGIAIAGVMGGEESGVTVATTEVILESAYFDPAQIRRTSRALGLSSDSSYRFERGVDQANILVASARAAQLIAEIAGAEIGELSVVGKAQNDSRTIELQEDHCSRILGVEIPAVRVDEILTRLGLQKSSAGWTVPSYRQDLTRGIDLVEEVTRVFGIDQIPSRQSARFTFSTEADRAHDRRMELRRALAAQGFHETRTLSLIAAKPMGLTFVATPSENLVRVRNPLVEDQVLLRPSLLPGLLKTVATNSRAGVKALSIFEAGRVFSKAAPEESSHLALMLGGPIASSHWRGGADRNADIFDLKSVLSAVLHPHSVEFQFSENPALALSLRVVADGVPVGFAGQLLAGDARDLDATAPVLFAEINLEAIPPAESPRYREINRFPAVTRDIAMLVANEVPHGRVMEVLERAKESLLESVVLFDVFADPAGEKTPPGQKSLAYSLTYRATDRTLSADEANAVHLRLKDLLKTAVKPIFRE